MKNLIFALALFLGAQGCTKEEGFLPLLTVAEETMNKFAMQELALLCETQGQPVFFENELTGERLSISFVGPGRPSVSTPWGLLTWRSGQAGVNQPIALRGEEFAPATFRVGAEVVELKMSLKDIFGKDNIFANAKFKKVD